MGARFNLHFIKKKKPKTHFQKYVSISMQYFGHTYTKREKKRFSFLLNSNLTGSPIFVFAKSDNPAKESNLATGRPHSG